MDAVEHFWPAEDRYAGLLERRWFAARRAAAETRAECDSLSDVLAMAQAALRSARMRLAQLEALRDALGEDLASVEGSGLEHAVASARQSAA